jgi:hypothetical protein
VFGINVVDVDHRAKANAGRFGIQLRFATRRGDSLPASLSPEHGLRTPRPVGPYTHRAFQHLHEPRSNRAGRARRQPAVSLRHGRPDQLGSMLAGTTTLTCGFSTS